MAMARPTLFNISKSTQADGNGWENVYLVNMHIVYLVYAHLVASVLRSSDFLGKRGLQTRFTFAIWAEVDDRQRV